MVKLGYKLGKEILNYIIDNLCVLAGVRKNEEIFKEASNSEKAPGHREEIVGSIGEGIYGLEHAALNWTWENGLKSMWMNMGYWKV